MTTNSRLGNDNLASSGYPLTDDKGLYLYFVPSDNYTISVVVPKPTSGKIAASWFNIFTGETRDETGSDWQMFKSFEWPWKGKSAVLILEGK